MSKDLDENLDLELQNELENIKPYTDFTAAKEDVIRQIYSCPVCGCNLHFTYFADAMRLLTHEVSRCNECGYRTQKERNLLQ